ncbi:piggyBac transposable element-derived protein 4-like [Lineus longissimus]|uniref:piggyBac transposable element-derived protein 4-like n=1 Tax=Lineus longissimus TaxID=88925 RepID=UPI00315DCFFF
MAKLKTVDDVVDELMADSESDDGDLPSDLEDYSDEGDTVDRVDSKHGSPVHMHAAVGGGTEDELSSYHTDSEHTQAEDSDYSPSEGERADMMDMSLADDESDPSDDFDMSGSAPASPSPSPTPSPPRGRGRVRTRGGRGRARNPVRAPVPLLPAQPQAPPPAPAVPAPGPPLPQRGGGGRRGRGRGRGRGQQPAAPQQAAGPVWQDDNGEVPNWLPNLQNQHPAEPVMDCTDFTPVDFFLVAFPEQAIQLMCDETNRYYSQWYEKTEAAALRTGIRHSGDETTKKQWKDVDLGEMKAFIAILLIMGNNLRPTYKAYWSTDWLTHMEGFRKVMSRDRFLLVLRFLHVADNTGAVPRGQQGFDRCFKIRQFANVLVDSWKRIVNPDKHVSVDECMVAFKGRVAMRQYMPKKPTKWGMKAWVLAGSKTGFVFDWKLYSGKEGDNVERNLGRKVVLDLTDMLPPGHEVYFDNYFNSYELLQVLEGRGLGGCGTLRSNRTANPAEIKMFTTKLSAARLQAMSPILKRCGNILALGWYDKRPVSVMSNIHTAEMMNKRVRDANTPGGHRNIRKPMAVDQYNKYMGGVDSSDQLNSYNRMVRKSLKWWKKVLLHLLVTAVSNAYVMYRMVVPKEQQKQGYEFRIEVAKELVVGYERRPSVPGRPSVNPAPFRLTERHFIEKGDGKKPDCVACCLRRNNKYVRRKQTVYRCKNCVPKVALCIIPCFELYHTQKDYKAKYEEYLRAQDQN